MVCYSIQSVVNFLLLKGGSTKKAPPSGMTAVPPSGMTAVPHLLKWFVWLDRTRL